MVGAPNSAFAESLGRHGESSRPDRHDTRCHRGVPAVRSHRIIERAQCLQIYCQAACDTGHGHGGAAVPNKQVSICSASADFAPPELSSPSPLLLYATLPSSGRHRTTHVPTLPHAPTGYTIESRHSILTAALLLQELEFIIYPDGRIEERVRGIKGVDCQSVTAEINKELGEVHER